MPNDVLIYAKKSPCFVVYFGIYSISSVTDKIVHPHTLSGDKPTPLIPKVEVTGVVHI